MPVWPTFTSIPMRSTRPRRITSADTGGIRALLAWHVWSRSGGPPTPAVRVAGAVIAGLDERERIAIDMWLAGTADKLIAERTGLALLLVADVRWKTLTEVARRLTRRPSAARQSGRWAQDMNEAGGAS